MNQPTTKTFRAPGFATEPPYTNEQGCHVVHKLLLESDRYQFDFEHCKSEDGWVQYDTQSDAWYYGVWVRPATREIVEYAEGDVYHITAPTAEIFKAKLKSMEEFHGPPPPAIVAIGMDGSVTEYYSERPTGD